MSSESKQVCVVGASGRMGGRVLDALSQSSNLRAYSAIESAERSEKLPSELIVSADPIKPADPVTRIFIFYYLSLCAQAGLK